MKTGIHPEYMVAKVTCACGRVTETRATVPELHVDICSHCHPFFTGRQKLVDTAGRVERFRAKYGNGEPSAESEDRPEAEASAEAGVETETAPEAAVETEAAPEAAVETEAAAAPDVTAAPDTVEPSAVNDAPAEAAAQADTGDVVEEPAGEGSEEKPE